jgi:hypothetical protein
MIPNQWRVLVYAGSGSAAGWILKMSSPNAVGKYQLHSFLAGILSARRTTDNMADRGAVCPVIPIETLVEES